MLGHLFTISTLIGATLDAGPVKSGHATADWISASATVAPGGTIETAIRIRIDDGWHIYWTNPGEGGMKTAFDITLPPGWKADGPGFPAPAHFLTNGLGSFGYAGTVLFPLRLTAPADFGGNAQLRTKITWLSCDDAACIPGEAEVTLTVSAGAPRHPKPRSSAMPGNEYTIPRPKGSQLCLRRKTASWSSRSQPPARSRRISRVPPCFRSPHRWRTLRGWLVW
jgi:thiol:disulfide interchange protein DsbD